MMIMPLVVRYDEVARGSVNHAIRFCVNNTDISPTFKWPARTAAGAWNPETGMPYGTRLRIKASWWNAHADSVLGKSTQARIIGEGMRRYGLVLADGSGGSTIQLQGVADLRWESGLHDRLNSIPVTALEVVSTPPLLQITGPTYLQVGQMGTWTLTFLPAESPVGSGSNINIWDQNNNQIQYAWATIDEAHRSVIAQRSFTQTGVYTIKPYEDWNTGFGPYRITVGTSATINATGGRMINPQFSVVPNAKQFRFLLPCPEHVLLRIFDPGGKLRATVVNGTFSEGSHTVTWDRGIAGCYFAVLRAGTLINIQKFSIASR